MSELTTRKSYNLLNIMKTIAAFFVVTIHVHFPGNLGESFICIARFAVPFFFMISGFFSFYGNKKMTREKFDRKASYILRILVLSCAFSAIFYSLLSSDYIPKLLGNITSPKHMLTFLLFNNTSCFAEHLWYLSALLYCIIIFYFLDKLSLTKKLRIPIILLFFVGIVIREVSVLTDILPNTDSMPYLIRNFVFIGLPFFYLGHLIREYEEKLKKLPYILLAALIIIGTLMSLADHFFHIKKSAYIGTFIAVFALFILLIKAEDKFKYEKLERLNGKYSLYIYIFHVAIWQLLKHLNIFSKINPFIAPIVIFALSFILAAVITNVTKLIKSKKK